MLAQHVPQLSQLAPVLGAQAYREDVRGGRHVHGQHEQARHLAGAAKVLLTVSTAARSRP